MFSLRNDLLSQFCVLFANSSLAAYDSVDNRILGHYTEQMSRANLYFPCLFPYHGRCNFNSFMYQNPNIVSFASNANKTLHLYSIFLAKAENFA